MSCSSALSERDSGERLRPDTSALDVVAECNRTRRLGRGDEGVAQTTGAATSGLWDAATSNGGQSAAAATAGEKGRRNATVRETRRKTPRWARLEIKRYIFMPPLAA